MEDLKIEDAMSSSYAFTLRQNFSWVIIGNLISAGCQWGILIVLAKLGTIEMLGQYALGLAIVNPIMAFSGFQLRTLISTDASREIDFAYFLSLRACSVASAVIISAVIALLSNFRAETRYVIIAVSLTKSFDALSDVFYGLCQQRERMDRIGKSQAFQACLQLVMFSLLIFVTHKIVIAVLGMASVSVLILLTYDIKTRDILLGEDRFLGKPLQGAAFHGHILFWRQRYIYSQLNRLYENVIHGIHRVRKIDLYWDNEVLRRIIILGLPLGLVTALNSLTGNIPRYVISQHLGERALGIYAALFYITIMGSLLLGALGDAFSPRLAILFARRAYPDFIRLFIRLLGVALLLGGGGLLAALIFGKYLINIFYKAQYAEQSHLFVWLMAATVFLYLSTAFGVAVTAMRRFYAQLSMSIVNLVSTYLLSIYFIPRYGLNGAGIVLFFNAVLAMLLISSLFAYYWTLNRRRPVI